MRNAPKMKNTQENRAMAAAPTAMKMPRKISAKMMPTIRANCCRCRGTFRVPMMMTKMNRLSMDKLYSVSQPAKNSPAYRGPETAQTPRPNRICEPDEDADEDSGFLHRWFVWPATNDEDVDGQYCEHHDNGDDPGENRNIHGLSGIFRD
jgi:hypothetical protein